MNIYERLDALTACGSAEQVAELLLEARAFGERNSATRCPVAVYLRKAHDVDRVWADHMDMEAELETAGRPTVRRLTPLAVAAFMYAFDDGKYKQLEGD